MDLIGTLALVFAAAAAAVTYPLTRRDIGPGRAALAAVIAAVLVGGAFVFVLYLAVLAFAAAVVAYLAARRRLPTGGAMLAAGVVFAGVTAAAVVAFSLALSTM